MSAAPRMSLTLETCLILPDTPSAHTHSHRKTHNFTHFYECKHLQIYPPAFCFLFHTGVHLDTEHLTASGAVTSRKTTDTTKSRCCVASRREQVQCLCCLCETEGAERRPDKATHPDTHTHTHTHTHTWAGRGSNTNVLNSQSDTYIREIQRLHPLHIQLCVGRTTK